MAVQRELKVKGWDGEKMLPPQDLSVSGEHWEWPGKVDAILLQFIGRTDKNGTEIYAGDVLDLHSTVNGVNLFSVFYDKSKARFSIRYHTDRMTNRSLDYEYSVTDFLKPCEISGEVDYEVVGNIYQHPELITQTC